MKVLKVKTKVGYQDLNIDERMGVAKTASRESWQVVLDEMKSVLFRPVRQVTHFGLVIVILIVLLSGVPTPRISGEKTAISVDPFGIQKMTKMTENAGDKVTASETVAMIASVVNDDMGTDAYEQINNQSAETKMALSGNAIAKLALVETTSSSKAKTKYTKYVVKNGDTLWSIARDFGITTDSIKWTNGIADENMVKPGQTLNIPSVTGIVHVVQSGETIESIASKYKTSANLIISQNDLYGESITVGMEIIVPDGVIEAPPPPPAPKVTTPKVAASSGGGRYGSSSAIGRTGSFRFPTIAGPMGYYNGYHWWAIDIPNSVGTPIYAADSGRIAEAKYGYNGGYGNTILLDHGDGFQTRYAHMSTLLILGGYVEKGQVIGYMGSTGRSTGSHLHFEISVNGAKQNPMKYF